MAEEEPQVHLAIASRLENIELVQVVLEDLLKRLGLEEDDRHWIDLAVREAVANAIRHGNRDDPGKEVEVDVALAGEELVIRVGDEGAGFDPSQRRDPRAPDRLLQPNGRGIFYMENFMDEVAYDSRPGGGTVVTLRKRIGRPETQPASTQEEKEA